jgi:hypothetical protein
MAVARRKSLSSIKFLAVYTPAARDGESLAQIAKRLTEKYKENYDSVDVSQKASVARKYLRDNAEVLKTKFGVEDIEKHIEENVPNVGGQGGGGGRKSGLAGLEALFATLTPPKAAETEATAEGAEAKEVAAEATETEAAE